MKIVFLLAFFTEGTAQVLFLQDTYRGGVSVDGREYWAKNYLQPDMMIFANSVPATATIRKSYLISTRSTFNAGTHPPDTPFNVIFNNITITFDSTDIAANGFTCDFINPTCIMWVAIKDVTSLTHPNNNKLATTCQTCSLHTDSIVYDGFLLVIEYEDVTMPTINTAIFLNNLTPNTSISYAINNLNPIDNTKDIALSVFTLCPTVDSITFNLVSSLGNTNLGTLANLYMYDPDSIYFLAPGSFYYQNNTAYGLKDDNPGNGFDTTDALVNVKNYVANGVQSFTLITTEPTDPACVDIMPAFILAYSTPCPAQSTNDSTIDLKTCRGTSITLAANGTAGNSYFWYATDNSLSNVTSVSITVTPTVTTSYTALIDSAGCKHTQRYKVRVYRNPEIDSLTISNAVCGGNLGSSSAIVNNGTKPYQYSIGAGNQNSPDFSSLSPGIYTLTVTDNMGCSDKLPFTIAQVNPAVANFAFQPTIACLNILMSFTNTSTGTNFQWWSFGTDTSIVQNPSYAFADTGSYNVTLIVWNNLPQCSDTITKSLFVKECPPDSITVIAPNIFTPNADGLNDTWLPLIYESGFTVKNLEVVIFDRWGLKVFESRDTQKAWDGRTTSGSPCADGTYYYVLSFEATAPSGKKNQTLKGFLQLMR